MSPRSRTASATSLVQLDERGECRAIAGARDTQLVALEVAGSNPVIHPNQNNNSAAAKAVS
jgi:hypothetical protein